MRTGSRASTGTSASMPGFLTGHSAIRRVVMGEACHETATDEQIREMARLVTEACRAGALGFSTSRAPTHNDGNGEPVPSRGASLEELVTLASAVAEMEGTTLAGILDGSLNGYTQEETELLTAMSVGANRPINWNVLGGTSISGGSHTHQLAASDYAATHGGRVVALTLPNSMGIRLSFLSGFALDGLPGWGPVIKLPVAERMRALSDPEVRHRLREGAASDTGVLRLLADWSRLRGGRGDERGEPGHRRTHHRGDRRRARCRPFRRALRHCRRRRPAHRAAARRRPHGGRGVEAAGRRLARSAHRRRRLGCRAPTST